MPPPENDRTATRVDRQPPGLLSRIPTCAYNRYRPAAPSRHRSALGSIARHHHVRNRADPSRDLLFGLLALQTGLIDQGALFAAFAAWTRDKARPLADHLVALGHLDAPRRAAVEAIAGVHVQALGGDIEKSLAVLAVERSTRDSLVRSWRPGRRGDPRARRARRSRLDPPTTMTTPTAPASYSVGSATSDGQRFRILRPHARGGLGAVFVALDGELHREVALKQILEKHADDPVSRQRFVAEAEITGGLEHPGVVPVYGLGTDAGGRPYYAMRFIKGDSLKEAIDAVPRGRGADAGPRPPIAGAAQAAAPVHSTSATPSTTPTRAG